MIFLHAEFLPRKRDEIRRAVDIFPVIPVLDEAVLSGLKFADLLHRPRGGRLDEKRLSQRRQLFPDDLQPVHEGRSVSREGRHEKGLLPRAGADEEHPVLHGPFRAVGLLPQEERIKRAVCPLVMMLSEKAVDVILVFYAEWPELYDVHSPSKFFNLPVLYHRAEAGRTAEGKMPLSFPRLRCTPGTHTKIPTFPCKYRGSPGMPL